MIVNRRDFLKLSVSTLAVGCLPFPALAAIPDSASSQRRLAFLNTHTGESLDICYFNGQRYDRKALDQVDYILRDHRAGETHPIDLQLLDTLHAIKSAVKPKTPFHVISGYRTPATNGLLRRQTSGVARTSYHTKGRAIDIRLPGFRTGRLRNLCIAMKSGGVGYYPDSDFVHVDTGPVRNW